jgi:hypothetical protein
VQPHQTSVKGDRQQPDGQREDKKKAEETAMKLNSRMEIRRFVMVGRSVSVNPVRTGFVGSHAAQQQGSLCVMNLRRAVNPWNTKAGSTKSLSSV